jgi:hypothetical protein
MRYIDEDGWLMCNGFAERKRHGAHISSFYTKPLTDGVRWSDPVTGTEFGHPSTRCRNCSKAYQKDLAYRKNASLMSTMGKDDLDDIARRKAALQKVADSGYKVQMLGPPEPKNENGLRPDDPRNDPDWLPDEAIAALNQPRTKPDHLTDSET